MYLSKPVVFVVLALFWVVTGLLSLGPAHESAVDTMQGAGAGVALKRFPGQGVQGVV